MEERPQSNIESVDGHNLGDSVRVLSEASVSVLPCKYHINKEIDDNEEEWWSVDKDVEDPSRLDETLERVCGGEGAHEGEEDDESNDECREVDSNLVVKDKLLCEHEGIVDCQVDIICPRKVPQQDAQIDCVRDHGLNLTLVLHEAEVPVVEGSPSQVIALRLEHGPNDQDSDRGQELQE